MANVTPQSQAAEAAPAPPPAHPQTYEFPSQRLRQRQLHGQEREPLVLVACGSFSPLTYLHLRMFEMARDFARFNTNFEIIGGYLSPVSDAYKKSGLAPAVHRLEMCDRAAQATSTWLMVDRWEATQTEYVPTAKVLDHFNYELNERLGGVDDGTGNRRKVHIALLAGADLIQTMSTPGLWSPTDLSHILGDFGAFIIERMGTDVDEALESLKQWADVSRIWVIPQVIQNDVSSTKIRLFLKRDMSVRYLIPEPVIRYIDEHRLYEDTDKEKPKENEKEEDKPDAAEGSSKK